MNRKTFLILLIITGLSLALLSDCELFEEPLGTCTVVCGSHGFTQTQTTPDITEYQCKNGIITGVPRSSCKITWVENK
jgi:hypothetical protein